MANILDRYGIKEVADVTFYDLNDDGSMGAPVLYLDTLKVSTIETTAENVSARGGKGNPELVTWDYGKEITVTLEDALFSAKSMAIMFGSLDANGKTKVYQGTEGATIHKTLPVAMVNTTAGTAELNGVVVSMSDPVYYTEMGVSTSTISEAAYVTFIVPTVTNKTIEVSSATFPGTYYITGDTYARSDVTGKDEFFQFIIPKAKVTSEVTLTMEAEGDPSTFSMNLRVLRPADGQMMKLVQYTLAANG